MHRLLLTPILGSLLFLLSSLSVYDTVWKVGRRRTRVVSTVRRRRELSARRARAAREFPTEREDDFAWNMQARFSPPRPRLHFFTLFPLYPARPRLYNIDTQLLYIQFARFPRSLRNTGFSPRGFSCSSLYTRVGYGIVVYNHGSGFICATSHLSLPPFFSTFHGFSFLSLECPPPRVPLLSLPVPGMDYSRNIRFLSKVMKQYLETFIGKRSFRVLLLILINNIWEN